MLSFTLRASSQVVPVVVTTTTPTPGVVLYHLQSAANATPNNSSQPPPQQHVKLEHPAAADDQQAPPDDHGSIDGGGGGDQQHQPQLPAAQALALERHDNIRLRLTVALGQADMPLSPSKKNQRGCRIVRVIWVPISRIKCRNAANSQQTQTAISKDALAAVI